MSIEVTHHFDESAEISYRSVNFVRITVTGMLSLSFCLLPVCWSPNYEMFYVYLRKYVTNYTGV